MKHHTGYVSRLGNRLLLIALSLSITVSAFGVVFYALVAAVTTRTFGMPLSASVAGMAGADPA